MGIFVKSLSFASLWKLLDTECQWCVDCMGISSWGLFHQQFFHHSSNSLEHSYCCYSITVYQITTNVCTFHDSTVVLWCAKFWNNHCIGNKHQICIVIEKLFVKETLGNHVGRSHLCPFLSRCNSHEYQGTISIKRRHFTSIGITMTILSL